MSEVTRLLQAIGAGEAGANDKLLSLVYDELRQLATSKMARESPGQTLQATALVNEVYLRLFPGTDASDTDPDPGDTDSDSTDRPPVSFQSRSHFFGAAAEAMRRVLIDHARSRRRLKRGGDRQRVDWIDVPWAAQPDAIDLLALDEALGKLEQIDPVKAQVVKLRYFAGLTIEQTADAMEISQPSVKRYWNYSRAWLRREMESGAAEGDKS